MVIKPFCLTSLGVLSIILLSACEAKNDNVERERRETSILGDSKYHSVEFENDLLKIIRMSVRPGEHSSMYHHGRFIGLHLTDIDNLLTMPDGSTRSDKRKAHYVWESKSGETHSVRNMREESSESIYIQLKGGYKPSAATVANGFDSEVTQILRKLLLEGDDFRVYKSVFPEGATEPEHSHNAKVTVFLNGGHILIQKSTGEEFEVKRATGEAVYGDEVVHSAKNIGPTMEVIILELM